MAELPTVPVDADKVGVNHLIPVDGLIARIHHITQVTPRVRILHWASLDHVPDVGTLTVRGDTVLCVRYADWAASREQAVSHG